MPERSERPTDPARRSWPVDIFVPVALSVLLGVLLLGLFVARAAFPSDGGGHVDGGVFEETGLAVAPPDPGRTSLRSGMIVTAIDGVPIDELLSHAHSLGEVRAGDVVSYRVLDRGQVRDIRVRMVNARIGRSFGAIAAPLLATTAILCIAIYVFYRRASEPAAAAFLAFGSGLWCATSSVVVSEPADLAFRPWMWWIALFATSLSFSVYLGGLAHFALVFPRAPRWIAQRRGFVVPLYLAVFALAVVFQVVLVVTGQVDLQHMTTLNDFAPLPGVLLLALGLGNVAVNLVRARRDVSVRRDIRLVAVAFLVTVVVFVALNVASSAFAVAVPEPLYIVPLLVLPLAIAYAILRRGLFDMPVVVNRTIVYLTVTAALVAAYAVALAVLTDQLRLSERAAAIPLTAVVAVAFTPLRARLQQRVNRAMYGRRDDPYQVLAEVGRGIRSAADPVEALERLVAAVAEALRLRFVAVRAGNEGGTELVAVGQPFGELVHTPVEHAGEQLGVLSVGRRSPGEPLSDADTRLLADVATQAGFALHALRLSDALARSRKRALTAAEDERQRIRRDLHDGLGPALAGISLQASAALDTLPPDSPAAAPLMKVASAAADAKAEIRRIIDGMAPAQLEQFGLMAAVRALGDQLNGDPALASAGHPAVSVAGPASLDAVDPATEVALYRVAAEAIVNAVRHSGGTRCDVQIGVSGPSVHLVVGDDGRGVLPSERGRGVGISSMRARVAALNGTIHVNGREGQGTMVSVVVPAHPAEDDE
ncbi:MAG: hypothetical protein QOF21_1067 [Actinomycetota bacterium]|jgi:signal transduction histidine kinase